MSYEPENNPELVYENSEILTFLQLMNKEFPDVPWDVEGIFESGTINMISAPPNQYKSWVVQHIALCLAQGKEVFEQFKTKKQSVLIVNEEDNLRMIKDRLIKMTEKIESLGVYFMVGTGFKIDATTILEILHEAQKRKVTFVIFDSLRSIHSANENDSGEMQEIMDCFKELTKEGITILFTHHNRKKDKYSKGDSGGEESRGSTAINAAVHGHISCEEIFKEDGVNLLIHQRKLKCDKKMDPFLVKVEADKEKNKMLFLHAGKYDAKEDTFRKNKEAILGIIENSNKWICKKEIVEFTDVGISAVNKVLRELEIDNFVQSKTKKELEKLGIKTTIIETKHNAKFYLKKDKSDLDEFVESLQADDGF